MGQRRHPHRKRDTERAPDSQDAEPPDSVRASLATFLEYASEDVDRVDGAAGRLLKMAISTLKQERAVVTARITTILSKALH